MSWFGPKLEPGERMVLRHPPAWFAALVVFCFAGVTAAATISGLHGRKPSLHEGAVLENLAIGAVVILAALFFLGRWQVAVTDRRVILRRGFLGLTVEAMPRHEIKAVYFINSTLFIHGKARDISGFCLGRLTGPLLKEIDPLYDNLRLRTPGLRKKLDPGERVLLRLRRPAREVVFWTVLPALPLFVMVLLMTHPATLNAWLDLLPGLAAFGAVLLFILLLEVAFSFSWYGAFIDHWRVAVTDRRVMVRRGLLGTRRDEISREAIESVRNDRPAGRLHITGFGREIAIRCLDSEADQIVRALGRESGRAAA